MIYRGTEIDTETHEKIVVVEFCENEIYFRTVDDAKLFIDEVICEGR